MSQAVEARTITSAEHLQLLGLLTIARQHQRQVDAARDAMTELLATALGDENVVPVDDPYAVGDLTYGDRELPWLLDYHHITVVEPPPPTPDEREADGLRADLEATTDRLVQVLAALRTVKGYADDPGLGGADSYGGRLGRIVRHAQDALYQDDMREKGEIA